MVGLFTRTTAVLNLLAALTALAGTFLGPAWLAWLGSLAVVAVNLWTVLHARRRPDLVAEAEREDAARAQRAR